MKRTGTALIGAVLGLALLSGLSGSPAGATSRSGSTTLTLTAGTDTSSAKPFTFEQGVAYDITVSGALTSNISGQPPVTCDQDMFFQACSQTGTPEGSWQRQGQVLQLFDDPHNYNTNSAIPGEPASTVTYHSNHTYSWVVPATAYAQTTTKYFWARPWGSQSSNTTTYSGQITVTLTPHAQQNRFAVRFTVVGLPKNPPGGLQDVTLAGHARIKLTSYSPSVGESSLGTANGKLTEVEEIKLGSGPENRRKLTLADAGGSAVIQNFSGGAEAAKLDGFKVTTSDDPHCAAGLSTASVFVLDSPKSPDRVALALHCESQQTQHTFHFSFVNSDKTHVTTAIVGPQ